jgi:hypothetical protein
MRVRGIHRLAIGFGLAVMATLLVVPLAEAGKGHGKKHHHQKKHKGHHAENWEHPRYGHVRYVIDNRHTDVIIRPAYANSFIVFESRYLVVRPVPYYVVPRHESGVTAQLGVHIGNVDLNVSFDNRTPLYGCNFCDTRLAAYDDWEEHVVACRRRTSRRVIPRPWEADDLDYFRDRANYSFVSDEYDYEDEDED